MRNLTQAEIDAALDDNGEPDEGCVAVETTIGELAELGAGTCCGYTGNTCFQALTDRGYGKRLCRGWFLANPRQASKDWLENARRNKTIADPDSPKWDENLATSTVPEVWGMFHIKIQTEKTAEKVENIAGNAGGSLRFNGESRWEGYMEFEIE